MYTTNPAIKNAFTPVENLSEGQVAKVAGIGNKLAEAAQFIQDNVPPGTLKATAMEKLLEVKWAATHAVTHETDVSAIAGGKLGAGPYNQ